MASEAEYERLYQEWVKNGGGEITLSNINTPAEYYDESSSITLSPEQLSRLQDEQAHYNRTQALQVFSSEISANNFTNPYDARSTTSITAFNNFGSSPGTLAMIALGAALGNDTVLLAGISSALGVDFGKMLMIGGLAGAGISMFGNLKNHTNSQIVNLPETLEQTSSLADMNKQFGVSGDSCSMFNELMGIMSGAFDGVMDFLDAGLDKLNSLLSPIINEINNIASAITGAIAGGIDSIVNAISDMIPQGLKDAFNEIGNIANSMMNGIAAIANQISSEIANLTSMAAAIASKLAALAMAAATLDPCKLAVLMNTGSPELKAAADKMIAPVTNIVSGIQTEIDPRANADEVQEIMSSAKQAAETAAGVPQSPMTAAAKLYTPFDSYLFDIEQNFSSIFGTEDKFEQLSTTSGKSIVAKLPETGSTNSSEKEIPETTNPKEFESNAFATWKSNYLNKLLTLRTNATKLRNEIKSAENAHYPNEALKAEAKSVNRDANKVLLKTKAHLDAVEQQLSYKSNTGKRLKEEEQIALDKYNNIYTTRTPATLDKQTRNLNVAQSKWNSIKSQIVI